MSEYDDVLQYIVLLVVGQHAPEEVVDLAVDVVEDFVEDHEDVVERVVWECEAFAAFEVEQLQEDAHEGVLAHYETNCYEVIGQLLVDVQYVLHENVQLLYHTVFAL